MKKQKREESVNVIDQNTKNKIILITLVAVIFILSLGVIIWVLMENPEGFEIETRSDIMRISRQNLMN